MNHLEMVLKVGENVEQQWKDQAAKHGQAALEAKSPLTAEAHRKESKYYHGKADGIRQMREMISDALKAEQVGALGFNERRHDQKRRERVNLLAAQTANRERKALSLAFNRFPTEWEVGAIWDAAVSQAVKDTALEFENGRSL